MWQFQPGGISWKEAKNYKCMHDLFPLSDLLRFCILTLILMLNYHRTVNILRLGMIRDLLFIGPWKTKKTTTAYSITSFPQFFNMLRFCILSLSFVLNCHGTVSPLHFRPIWHFSFLTPSKEWQCIVWLFSPHFRTCWDFAFYPLLSRGTIIGQALPFGIIWSAI